MVTIFKPVFGKLQELQKRLQRPQTASVESSPPAGAPSWQLTFPLGVYHAICLGYHTLCFKNPKKEHGYSRPKWSWKLLNLQGPQRLHRHKDLAHELWFLESSWNGPWSQDVGSLGLCGPVGPYGCAVDLVSPRSSPRAS